MTKNTNLFSEVEVLHIGQWAAEECHHQGSGERSVGWMLAGWLYAIQHSHLTITEVDIIHLAHLVEPRLNDGTGYRRPGISPDGRRHTGNVRVGGDVKCDWEEVPRRMSRLVGFLTDPLATVEPAEFFRQYEEVHPLLDGNGRTGSILYNWLLRSLAAPVAPPDFWSNRTLVHD